MESKPFDRRSHYRYMSRIYAVLNSAEWRIQFAPISGNRALCERYGVNGNSVGFVDEEGGRLFIDHRFDILATVIHECLHVLHTNMKEGGVRKLEIAIVARLTPLQARRLHMLIGAALL